MTASELMEQGIRAYTRGQLGEAERCWRDVLAMEPGNARAQSYLELLVGKLVRKASPSEQGAAVPLPAPESSSRPVPLPSSSTAAQPSNPRASAADRPSAAPAPAEPSPPHDRAPVRDKGGQGQGQRSAAPVPLPSPPSAQAPAVTFAPDPPPAPDPVSASADWMRPPDIPPPTAVPVEADEFASCWSSGADDEITTPITTAEPLSEAPAAAPSALSFSLRDPRHDDSERAAGTRAGFADFEVVGSAPDAPANVVPAPTLSAGAATGRTTLSEYAPSPWDEGPATAPAVVLDDGIGLDLATVAEQSGIRALVPESIVPASAVAQAPRSEVEIWMEGARELFALGDFSGSLEMIEKILKVDPSHVEAREYLKQNEATLIAMYESKLGPADAVPHLAIQPEEVMWLNLDHRAGFLLAQIDGTVSYEDLFALSGLPHLDTARILATLLQEGVIQS